MKIIKQGAEAILYLDKYQGSEVLVKKRIKKGYRISELDEKIRKMRTRRESKLLSDSNSVGVPTPRVFKTDENKNEIIMHYLGTERVKDLVPRLKNKELKELFEEVGLMVLRLHENNIIHGDLTTSNMIIYDKKLHFIDFGLGFFSKRIEDKATDLHLLHQALKSTHFNVSRICWEAVLKGYKNYKFYKNVLEGIQNIEARGRYKKRK